MEFVYFFRHVNSDYVKIGMTKNDNVKKRLDAFATYAPEGVINLGFIETHDATLLEKRLHEDYKEFRMKGEFFNISDDEVERIKENYGLVGLNQVQILKIVPITWSVSDTKRYVIALDKSGIFTALYNYYCIGVIVKGSTVYSSMDESETMQRHLERFDSVTAINGGLWYEVE